MLKIGDSLWHPCSVDVIEHKVKSITTYESFTTYGLKAVRGVGACGRIEVEVIEKDGKYTFYNLLNKDKLEHHSGLGDFIEGDYYDNQLYAKLQFYQAFLTSAELNIINKEDAVRKAVKQRDKVKLIVDNIKKDINAIYGEN